jgi:hypothetical protein
MLLDKTPESQTYLTAASIFFDDYFSAVDNSGKIPESRRDLDCTVHWQLQYPTGSSSCVKLTFDNDLHGHIRLIKGGEIHAKGTVSFAHKPGDVNPNTIREIVLEPSQFSEGEDEWTKDVSTVGNRIEATNQGDLEFEVRIRTQMQSPNKQGDGEWRLDALTLRLLNAQWC